MLPFRMPTSTELDVVIRFDPRIILLDIGNNRIQSSPIVAFDQIHKSIVCDARKTDFTQGIRQAIAS